MDKLSHEIYKLSGNINKMSDRSCKLPEFSTKKRGRFSTSPFFYSCFCVFYSTGSISSITKLLGIF